VSGVESPSWLERELGAASLPPCGEGSGMGVSPRRLPTERLAANAAPTEFAPPPLTPPRKGEGDARPEAGF